MKQMPGSETIRHNPQVGAPFPSAEDEVDTRTLALLEQWAAEDATDDPEVLGSAQKDLDEFKSGLNANRAANGEPLLF